MSRFREDCVFCDIRKIKADPIEQMYGADGSEHFVFEPLEPVVPGHLLVVPTTHAENATEDPLVTAMSAGVAGRVAMRYASANIITSIGAPATQTVHHLHWHVVPRVEDDGLKLPWTPALQACPNLQAENPRCSDHSLHLQDEKGTWCYVS